MGSNEQIVWGCSAPCCLGKVCSSTYMYLKKHDNGRRTRKNRKKLRLRVSAALIMINHRG